VFLYSGSGGLNRARGLIVAPLGRRSGSVPEDQVTEPINIDYKEDGQANQVAAILYSDSLQEESGCHEAEEQPQEETERGAHGSSYLNRPIIARNTRLMLICTFYQSKFRICKKISDRKIRYCKIFYLGLDC
jgi:hypothetical protein